MNILIVSPSIVVDVPNQRRIVNYFRDKANVTIRFASGVIQSIWQIRDFKPEIIVIDWVLECPYIRNLIATIHGMKPDAAMFHLDGDQLIASEKQRGSLEVKNIPNWLFDIASYKILARWSPIVSLPS